MIFQPVVTPMILVLLIAPLLFVTVRSITTARTPGQRALWVSRTLLVLLCFVMLMRPGMTGAPSQTVATNTDIYLVVDTTASIVAEDWNGELPRLDGIRDDIGALVEHYPGARYSLITFASNAEVRLPLTTDSSALMSSLTVLRPETTSVSKGSDIGAAANTLTKILATAAEHSTDRARMVFYFGDGEQTSARSPKSFVTAQDFVDGGAVFGYGTAEGGAMKVTRGLATDSPATEYIEYDNEIALSVIDPRNLEDIATQLGVSVHLRDALTDPPFPDAPKTSTTLTDRETQGGIFDLSWIVALAVILLVACELARATMLTTQLRGLRTRDLARDRQEGADESS